MTWMSHNNMQVVGQEIKDLYFLANLSVRSCEPRFGARREGYAATLTVYGLRQLQ